MEKNRFLSNKTSIAVKGIASVCIVLSHSYDNVPYLLRLLTTGYLWVGIFFFYSGYGLMRKYGLGDQTLSGFLPKKVIRIYLPFMLAELLYMVMNARFFSKTYTIKDILFGIIGLELHNTFFWYILHFLAVNLIFYLLAHFFKQADNLLLWFVLYVAYLVFCISFNLGTWWYISTFAVFMGFWFGKYQDSFVAAIGHYFHKNTLLYFWSLCFLILFFVLFNLFLYFATVTGQNPLFLDNNYYITCCQFGMTPLFVLLIMALFQKVPVANNVTLFLGGIAFEIYLYHEVVISLYQTYFRTPYQYLDLLIIVCFTIILSAMMHWVNQMLFFRHLRRGSTPTNSTSS